MEISKKCQDLLVESMKMLEDASINTEQRTGVYQKILISHISKVMQVVDGDMSSLVVRLWKSIKVDLKKNDAQFLLTVLQALSIVLHSPNIVSSLDDSILNEILEDLFTLMKNTKDKGVCTKVLWCLGKQCIPDRIFAEKVPTLISHIEMCIVSKHFESSSVEYEALDLIKSMVTKFPAEMTASVGDWFKLVYPFVISRAVKVANSALSIMEQNIQMLKENNGKFSQSLIHDLKSGLVERLTQLFSKKKELFVLRVWACLVTLLHKIMQQGSPLTNSLFKVVEQAFKANSPEVLIAAYKAWVALIDNFATSRDAIRSKKRLKLLLMPLVNSTSKSERDSNVEQARLETWWHLLCVLKNDLNEVSEQVVVPLLLFIFSSDEKQNENANVDLTLMKTPTKTNIKVEASSPKTPATSQYYQAMKTKINVPNLHFESTQLKMKGAEILYCILNIKSDKKLVMEINKDNVSFIKLSVESFKNSSVFFFIALQDLTISCGKQINGELLLALWNAYFQYVYEIAHQGDKNSLTISLGGLLQSLQRLCEVDCTPPTVALEIIINCYDVLKGSVVAHRELMKTDLNSHGSFPMHMLQMALNKKEFFQADPYLYRKLYPFVDTLVAEIMTGVTGQLTLWQHIMTSFSNAACNFADKDPLWRLWKKFAGQMLEYINRSNDINQGDSLKHDFTAVLEMLMFPINNLLTAEFTMAVYNDIYAKWEQLFLAFVREAELITTADPNQAIEEICFKIDAQLRDEKFDDPKFIGRLVNMLRMVTEKFEFAKMNPDTNLQHEVIVTPTKSNQLIAKKLGNSKSLVVIIWRILHRLAQFENIKVDCSEIDQLTVAIFDVIKIFFSKINGESFFKETIKRFSNPICVLLTSEKSEFWEMKSVSEFTKNKRNKFQAFARILNEIYRCILERYDSPIDDELLLLLTPLLKIAFSSDKEFIRFRTVNFWNKSFGASDHLHYPDDLTQVLLQVKTNVPLLLPGVKTESLDNPAKQEAGNTAAASPPRRLFPSTSNNQVVLVDSQPENSSQSSENSFLSQSPKIRMTTSILRSPHKVHGSFLRKALSAEKATRSPSPTKAVLSSPKTESKLKFVRRKLPLPCEENDNEFVKIEPSPKRRRILTEHQKEVMRSRSEIPVLYNELDQATQDAMISDDTQLTLDSFPGNALKRKPSPAKNKLDVKSLISGLELKEDASKTGNVGVNGEKTGGKSLKSESEKKDGVSKKSIAESLSVADCPTISSDTKAIKNKTVKRTSPRSQEKKSASGFLSMQAARRQSGAKPKARRSVAKSFKEFLASISSENKTTKEIVDVEETNEEVMPLDVVPSSYTFSDVSPPVQGLPFTFSTGSKFTSENKVPSTDKPSETIDPDKTAAVNSVESKITVEETQENHIATDQKANDSSSSLDFIPSSQSQRDASPMLKGVSLITPRSLPRQSKRVRKASSDKQGMAEKPGKAVTKKKKTEKDDKNIEIKEIPGKSEKAANGNDKTTESKTTENGQHETENIEKAIEDKDKIAEKSEKTTQNEKETGKISENITESNHEDLPVIPEDDVIDITDLEETDVNMNEAVVITLNTDKDQNGGGNVKHRDCETGVLKMVNGITKDLSTQKKGNGLDEPGKANMLTNVESTKKITKKNEFQVNVVIDKLVVEDEQSGSLFASNDSQTKIKVAKVADPNSKVQSEAEIQNDCQPVLGDGGFGSKMVDDQKGKDVGREEKTAENLKKVNDCGEPLAVDSKANLSDKEHFNAESCSVSTAESKENEDTPTEHFIMDKFQSEVKPLSDSSEQSIELSSESQGSEKTRVRKRAVSKSSSARKPRVRKTQPKKATRKNNAKGEVSSDNLKGLPEKDVVEKSEQQKKMKVYVLVNKGGEKGSDLDLGKEKTDLTNLIRIVKSFAEKTTTETKRKDSDSVVNDKENKARTENGGFREKDEIMQAEAHENMCEESAKANCTEDESESIISCKSSTVGLQVDSTSDRAHCGLKNTECSKSRSSSVDSPVSKASNEAGSPLPNQNGSINRIEVLDSSFEDELSLATIKNRAKDNIVICDSESTCEPSPAGNIGSVSKSKAERFSEFKAKQNVNGCMEKTNVNSNVNLEEAKVERDVSKANVTGASKVSRNRKRKLDAVPKNKNSKTVEIVFNSSNKSGHSLSANESFQILESKSSANDIEEKIENNIPKGKGAKDVIQVEEKAAKKKSSVVQENSLFTMVCEAELPQKRSTRRSRSTGKKRAVKLHEKQGAENKVHFDVEVIEDTHLVQDSKISTATDASKQEASKKQDASKNEINNSHVLDDNEGVNKQCSDDKQCSAVTFVHSRNDCSSPLQIKKSAAVDSPSVSPISGILKKRLCGKMESPSPPNKNRRVSFAYPLEEMRSIDDKKNQDKDTVLARPLPADDNETNARLNNGTPKRFTAVKSKFSSPKITSSKSPGVPICSDLITCSTPIEKLLPSLTSATWSRGLGNIIRAQNIRTIGNLCALSETQIEGLPIRSPKISNVKKALVKFQNEMSKSEKAKITSSHSAISTITPTKPVENLKEIEDKDTPSRKSLPKPTSLFCDERPSDPGTKGDRIDDLLGSVANYVLSEVVATASAGSQDEGNPVEEPAVAATAEPENRCESAPAVRRIEQINTTISTLETMLTAEQLSNLSVADSFMIHDKITKLSARVVDSLRAKNH